MARSKEAVPAHRFHHVSTDEVYGSLGPDDAPFHESSPYAPNSPYSASKAASDHLVRAYHETYGLDTTVTNCSNNYGPYQFPEKLIPLTLINILLGKPLPVYGDGLQVRDWLHVEDHCEAISLALDARQAGRGVQHRRQQRNHQYPAGAHCCAPWLDEYLADARICGGLIRQSPAASGSTAIELISHVRDRPGHDRRYAIDYRKAARELGYAPARDLAAGSARDALTGILPIRGWWEALLGRDYAAWVEKNYQ